MSDVKNPQQVRFHYLKASSFCTLHADGFFGAIAPNGMLNLTLFVERFPIPQVTTHELLPGGALGDEVLAERVERDGIIRDLQANVVMTMETARQMRDVLSGLIETWDRAQTPPPPATEGNHE